MKPKREIDRELSTVCAASEGRSTESTKHRRKGRSGGFRHQGRWNVILGFSLQASWGFFSTTAVCCVCWRSSSFTLNINQIHCG
ncbi:hypothetical protein LWI28_000027 [Acer negundo]|uniref:Uncharacterized protein n=1 Tax=Acer negundo TaxID=4023 RepID=A0AAD5NEB8_ACENE|nr:hypothetical protein LWI28_000027 [Acer negundo]